MWELWRQDRPVIGSAGDDDETARESWVSAWMALAGTLLVAGLAQAQTPQVSAQEVIMKLQSAMSKEHSLIDNREKLKAAYKADSKSPETQEP